MYFAYDGFTHNDGKRCFLFHRVEAQADQCFFSIQIELALLARNRVAVQDAPSFCLQMLQSACASSEGELKKLQNYEVVSEDFRPLVTQREKREIELRLKKRARRVLKPRPDAPVLPEHLFSPGVNRAV